MVYVSPAAQATTDAYVVLVGSQIDTAAHRDRSIGYYVAAATAGITTKVQGSIDGVTWVDLVMYDETGTAHGAAGVAIAADAADWLLLGPAAANGAKSAFRYYRLAVKSTVEATPGSVTARGFSK